MKKILIIKHGSLGDIIFALPALASIRENSQLKFFTGFKSLLLGETFEEPFESLEDMLPNNSAWATRMPYTNREEELVPYTNCTAIENGWVWNIPLWDRIGTGYVYSDKFVDDETALKEFKRHLGRDDLEFKNIKMKKMNFFYFV